MKRSFFIALLVMMICNVSSAQNVANIKLVDGNTESYNTKDLRRISISDNGNVTVVPSKGASVKYAGNVDQISFVKIPEGKYKITSENLGLYNKSDFERVKKSLENGTAPAAVRQEFEALKNSRFAKIGYTPNPLEWVVRGKDDGNHGNAVGKENYGRCMNEAAVAYQTAMLWHLTGDERYAETSANMLNQWAAKCKGLFSTDSNVTLLAAQGFTFACAGIMLKDYKGWSAEAQVAFKKWMVDVWAASNKDFMVRHHDTCLDHYWSNWDLVCMCSYLAIGILTRNDDMIDYIVDFFHRGGEAGMSNGCIYKLCNAFHYDPLGSGEIIGQNQESGRDQGHAQMSVAVAAQLAQLAYSLYKTNPDKTELDFFAANDNALMKMGEYVALFNLRNGKDQLNAEGDWLIKDATKFPFKTYYYCGGANQEGPKCTCKGAHTHSKTHTTVADGGSRGSLRPNWEIYYNHYKYVKKLDKGYMYAQMAADKARPECGTGDSRYGFNSGAFDQVGWNTLMLYQGE